MSSRTPHPRQGHTPPFPTAAQNVASGRHSTQMRTSTHPPCLTCVCTHTSKAYCSFSVREHDDDGPSFNATGCAERSGSRYHRRCRVAIDRTAAKECTSATTRPQVHHGEPKLKHTELSLRDMLVPHGSLRATSTGHSANPTPLPSYNI